MSRSVRSTLVIVSVAAVAVTVLVTSGCEQSTTSTTTQSPPPSSPPPGTTPPTPTVQPGGDDDRPPVIISGGSIHLRMVARDRGKGKNQNHGEWKEDTGKWVQEHDMQKAKKLFVNVLYGSGGTNCDNPEWNFDVDSLVIDYNDGAAKKFSVSLEAKDGNGQARLVTDADAKKDAKLPFWLELKNASARLVSVTFPDGTVCTLDHLKSQVHIYPTNNKDPR